MGWLGSLKDNQGCRRVSEAHRHGRCVSPLCLAARSSHGVGGSLGLTRVGFLLGKNGEGAVGPGIEGVWKGR